MKALFTLGKVYFMKGDRIRARSFIGKARRAGDESAELLHALNCLESKEGCDALEMASSRIQEK